MAKKIVASIEARMTSTRLPGKVLMDACPGISMLEYMINRVKKSKLINEIIVATTINRSDEPIIELCKSLGIPFFRGSENDVLSRVLEAHKMFGSEIVVELTGDCPLIDPVLTDQIIDQYLNNNFDYVSNAHVRSYPDGFDVQVFSLKILEEISKLTSNEYDRENVSSYIYRSNRYKLKAIIAEPEVFWPDLRVTLDDNGDLLLIRNIIDHFLSEKNPDYLVGDVVEYLKNNLRLLELNKEARAVDALFQKKLQK